jgi:hypothetical protein
MDKTNLIILKYLSLGLTQQEVSNELKKKDIKPNSLSAIEKRIKKIKQEFKAKNNFHLAIIVSKKNILKSN